MDHEMSPDTARDVIHDLLVNLTGKQFKRFKILLPDISVEADQKKIPRSRLENADCMDVSNTMVQYYDDRKAFEATEDLLKKIPDQDLLKGFKISVQKYFDKKDQLCEADMKDFSKKRKLSEAVMKGHKRKYKKHIKKEFGRMRDNDSRMGENVTLKERYTELLISKNYRNKKDKEHEIMSYGERHRQLMAERAAHSYSNIKDLFSPEEDGHVPRTVVLQGVAGIGKTMTARKIMFDWASGNLFQDRFEYVFYIHCREYNQPSAERSLADLIIPSIEGGPRLSMSEIEANPSKVLFIIDGFDELKITEGLLFDDPAKKIREDKTIFSLIRKRYLSESYLIITTKPTALDILEKCVKHERLAEIRGFSDEDIVKYFSMFFEDKLQRENAIKIVKENEIVYTMCFVPLVCWIVCTVIKEQMENKEENKEESLCDFQTITSVYLLLFLNLLKQQNRDLVQHSITNNLKSLCALAGEGVYLHKILFEEHNLRHHGVDNIAVRSLFLENSIFKKETERSSLYSFIHLSVQEFFAALFYILEGNVTTTENTESPQRNVIQLLTDYTESDYNHLMLTVRFLFGLLNAERLEKMKREFQWKISPEIKPAVQAWIEEKLKAEGADLTRRSLDLFHCLYESQDEELVKVGSQCVKCIYLTPREIRSEMISMECRVLEYCLKYSEVETIDLKEIRMRPEDVSTLKPLLKKCSSIKFHSCFLTDSCCEDLASVLETNMSLQRLELLYNVLGHSGVKMLCEGLNHPHCKLKTLGLICCSLTDSCYEELASVLKTNTSLTQLNLGGNSLGDSGVKKLCEGLNNPDCKVQQLRLQHCSLTSSCCEDFVSVLKTSASLEALWLSGNELGDSGVKALCEGLRNYSLQKLCLCGIDHSSGCLGDSCKTVRKTLELIRRDVTSESEDPEISGYISDVKMDQKHSAETACGEINLLLEELTGKQLKEFQIRLHRYTEKPGRSAIPKSRLENATRLETAKAITERYDDQTALGITKLIIEKKLKIKLSKESGGSTKRSDTVSKLGENPTSVAFIKRHRLDLIDRMGNIKSIMIVLQHRDILQEDEVEEVLAEKISSSKNSKLIETVIKKGPESVEEFLLALQKKNPPLYRDLVKLHSEEARKDVPYFSNA